MHADTEMELLKVFAELQKCEEKARKFKEKSVVGAQAKTNRLHFGYQH